MSDRGTRFVFGYEEALGYAVGDVVRDKDGISAALAMLGLTAQARAAGQSVLDRWDALETAHGVHLTAQLTLPTRAPGEIMAGLRAAPPAALGGSPVRGVTDLAPGGRCRPRTRSSSGWTAPGSCCGPAAPNPSSRPTWRSPSRPARAWPRPAAGPGPG